MYAYVPMAHYFRVVHIVFELCMIIIQFFCRLEAKTQKSPSLVGDPYEVRGKIILPYEKVHRNLILPYETTYVRDGGSSFPRSD